MNNNLLKTLLCAVSIFEIIETSASYTMENKNGYLETYKACYNTITKYIEQKRAEDNEFKSQFDNLVDRAQKNYIDMRQFTRDNKHSIQRKNMEEGYNLLNDSKKILQEIIKILNINESALYTQCEIVRQNINDEINYFEKIQKFNQELQNINGQKRKIQQKITECEKIKTKLTNDKMQQEKLLQEIIDKIENLNSENSRLPSEFSIRIAVNKSEINDFKKEKAKLENIIEDTNIELGDIEYYEQNCLDEYGELRLTIAEKKQQRDQLQTKLNLLREQDPIYYFAKYEYYIFWYVNKTHELWKLISEYALKFCSYDAKHKK